MTRRISRSASFVVCAIVSAVVATVRRVDCMTGPRRPAHVEQEEGRWDRRRWTQRACYAGTGARGRTSWWSTSCRQKRSAVRQSAPPTTPPWMPCSRMIWCTCTRPGWPRIRLRTFKIALAVRIALSSEVELDVRVYGDVGVVMGGYVVRVDPEGPGDGRAGC